MFSVHQNGNWTFHVQTSLLQKYPHYILLFETLQKDHSAPVVPMKAIYAMWCMYILVYDKPYKLYMAIIAS